MFYVFQAYLEQIEGFKRRRTPVHGIGVQGHFLGWTHPSILQVCEIAVAFGYYLSRQSLEGLLDMFPFV